MTESRWIYHPQPDWENFEWARPTLADLCGFRPDFNAETGEPIYRKGNSSMLMSAWRPDEDPAQALQCLEAFTDQGWCWQLTREQYCYWFAFSPPGEFELSERKAVGNAFAKAACYGIRLALAWPWSGGANRA